MLAVAKRRQRTPHDLANDIHRIHAEIAAFVEDRLVELKASPSGKDLPVEWLRGQILQGECSCRVALRILDE